ncbi:hypothetical protein JTE90_013879 [Oedothorax gibbosus]|uniref:Speckle-type POZ protein n=1 Tax=Oedothorax gibbosus TaxID=931172 RepID=A0AAV6VHI6_9ARAC|nr:hypothetical protein JTE90_013879 [Oedothorax gibbosus]
MSENVKKIQRQTNISTESCEFTWSIKNFRFCGLRDQEHLTSQEFTTSQSSLTRWRLILYPNKTDKKTGGIGIYLRHASNDSSAHYAYFELSIIDSYGIKYNSRECYHLYCPVDKGHGFLNFINRKVLFKEEHDSLLPQNTLTIMCELTTSRVDDYKTTGLTESSFKPTTSRVVFKKPDSLLFDLQHLYNSKMFSDFTLRVGDEEFKAHKNILCARSSVFNTMLNCEMEEKLTNCVKITEFDPPTVTKMLDYIYCGQVEDLTPEVALQLYSAAEKYNLQDLKDICAEYLSTNLSVDNFCDVLILAKLHNGEGLMKATKVFFRVNTAVIKKNEKWISLSKINPDLVIAMYEEIV